MTPPDPTTPFPPPPPPVPPPPPAAIPPAAIPTPVSPTTCKGILHFAEKQRQEIMDLTTALFLDTGDEGVTAELLASRYFLPIQSADVHSIRVEAAKAASLLKPSDPVRKRWAYRFCHLTLDNLVKEYMFVTRVPTFMEAKIDLADEVFWLSEKSSKARLCIAFNDALGRNSLTLALLDELLEFRESLLRVKALVATAADGASSPIFLLDIAEQTYEHVNQPGSNLSESAAFVANLLGSQAGDVKPADVRFLSQYHIGANLPDLTDPDGFHALFEVADTPRERKVVDEAINGNFANLTQEELRQLFEQLRTRPLLDKGPLGEIQKAVVRRLKRVPNDEFLQRLNTLTEGQLAVCDVDNLYTRPERFKLGLRGLPADEITRILNKANSLTARDEIRAMFRNITADESRAALINELSTRYMSKRFG